MSLPGVQIKMNVKIKNNNGSDKKLPSVVLFELLLLSSSMHPSTIMVIRYRPIYRFTDIFPDI